MDRGHRTRFLIEYFDKLLWNNYLVYILWVKVIRKIVKTISKNMLTHIVIFFYNLQSVNIIDKINRKKETDVIYHLNFGM